MDVNNQNPPNRLNNFISRQPIHPSQPLHFYQQNPPQMMPFNAHSQNAPGMPMPLHGQFNTPGMPPGPFNSLGNAPRNFYPPAGPLVPLQAGMPSFSNAQASQMPPFGHMTQAHPIQHLATQSTFSQFSQGNIANINVNNTGENSLNQQGQYGQQANLNQNGQNAENLDRKGDEKSPADKNKEPQIIGKWIEYYAEDGTPYYYDSSNQQTQWEIPEEFVQHSAKQKEKMAKMTKMKNNTKNSNQSKIIKDIKITIQNEGDTISPNDLKKTKSKNTELVVLPSKRFSPKEENSQSKDKKKTKAENSSEDENFNPFNMLSKEECVQMFKSLLEDQEVQHDSEWAGILSDIIKDTRYSAIKTLGERKRIFNDFLKEKKAEFRKKKREEIEQKMKEFYKMLESSEFVDLTTKFSDVEKEFAHDERFKELKYMEKRSLFSKFRESLRKKQREKEKKVYRENAPLFKSLLDESEKIFFNSTWENVKDNFISHECVKNLKAMERLRIFKKHVGKLKEEHKKVEKKLRAIQENLEKDFENLLRHLSLKKTLFHTKSQWEEVSKIPSLFKDKRYKAFFNVKFPFGNSDLKNDKSSNESLNESLNKDSDKNLDNNSDNINNTLNNKSDKSPDKKLDKSSKESLKESSKESLKERSSEESLKKISEKSKILKEKRREILEQNFAKGLEKEPEKIFERFCCDLEDELMQKKLLLKRFLRKKKHRVVVDDSVELLMEKLREETKPPKLSEDEAKILFLEMIAKAKYRESKKNN